MVNSLGPEVNNSFRSLRLDMTGRLHWPGAVCHPPPLPAIRDLDRAPSPPSARPPPQALRPPPPPATGRRSAGPAGRCGGGGRQDNPVMASAGRKTEVLTLAA